MRRGIRFANFERPTNLRVSHSVFMAFLGNLTEAILESKQAAHLSLDHCLGNIPGDWNRQRAQLLGQ
jgi:hypothetical protein